MESVWQDVQYGLRAIRNKPGFTLVVVSTLAFGIGANTTAFSVINTLFLNPLPVDHPAELVDVRTVDAAARSTDTLLISHLNLQDISQRNRVFESLAGYSSPMILTLLDGDTPRRLFGELVTGNYFETLGIHPFRGRFLVPQDDATPGASPVVVVSHAAWRERFGGQPDIVGKTLNINGQPFSVIGVAAKGFKGVNAVFGPDVWIPSMMAETVLPSQRRDWLKNRTALAFRGVARLKPGISPDEAGAHLAAIAGTLEHDYPDANRGRGLAVEPLTRAVLLAPGRMSAFGISVVLLAIPGLILLIACSNVANLLLSRAAGRRQEIAVRLALGSSRGRLLRQLLTESTVLACASGLIGFCLAVGGARALWSVRPAEVTANLIDLDINPTVFLFTLVVSVATGIIFGLVPAWHATRQDILLGFHAVEGALSAGRSRRRFTIGWALMVGQIALSLTSLVSAGLLLRSLEKAYLVDPGFETKRLGIALMSPGQAGYNRVQSERFYREVRARVSGIPGVVSSTWATELPLFGRPSGRVEILGREDRDRESTIMTIVNAIDVEYFRTTGITMTNGRDFDERDGTDTLPVAIVNEALASRAWPNIDPVSRELRLGGEDVTWRIVGVAKTANYSALGEAPQPCVYLPMRQYFSDAAVLYVRTVRDPEGVLGEIQGVIRSVDRHVYIGDVRTIETVIGQSLFGASVGVGLLSVFGLIALALASLGLYGAMAHAVTQREREIGVRMALGAKRLSVVHLVVRQGAALVGIGIVVGSGASVLAGKFLSGVLFAVTAIDAVSLGGASIVLAIAATGACYVAAIRASRLDALTALRSR